MKFAPIIRQTDRQTDRQDKSVLFGSPQNTNIFYQGAFRLCFCTDGTRLFDFSDILQERR